MNNEPQPKSPEIGPATFAEFNLKPEVNQALARMGFKEPSPVQSACYETTMSGVDVIVMAQTGTGKTAAFGIPMVQRVDAGKKGIQSLVMVPTRELAIQVCREIESIASELSVSATPIYGGTSFSNQVDQIKKGVQIVVATPGRMLDHIRRQTVSLAGLNMLVLDEADEMLSMGFERELSEIMDNVPAERQTMLFSATIPDDIRRLSGKYLNDPVTISVSGDEVGAEEISHYMYLITGAGRVTDLMRVLEIERPVSAIIFCNTRDETGFVSRALREKGLSAAAISSDFSQSEREKVLGALRNNKIQYLVATDVAARGIDVSHLSHVINFSFPDSLERYIHRTGRTGRQGRHGAAVSLISPHDIGNLYMLRLTYKINPVEKELPSLANLQQQDELDRLDALRSKARNVKLSKGDLALANRVFQSADAIRLIGTLLGGGGAAAGLQKETGTVGSAPNKKAGKKKKSDRRQSGPVGQPAEEKKPAEKKKAAPPVEKPVDWSKKADAVPATVVDDRNSADALVAERSSIVPDLSDPDGRTDIFIDTGRKDGLRISALMKDIVEQSGLQRTDVGKVRMLTRSTFISVPNSNCARVFKVLEQMEVGGRKLKVEYAQES